ncbi:MAG: sulfotransferase family 2 domain-containing protein [Bacteroidota bacterium]
MIISHQHKFIFLKPQKTAGTSVELLLSRICGSQDVITPLGFDPDPKVRQKHQAKDPQNYRRPKPFKHWQLNELFWYFTKGRKPHLNYWEHLTAAKVWTYAGEDIWDAYQKISIVRNPWDHAVSMYKWMTHYNFEKSTNFDLETFIVRVYKEMWCFYSIKNRYQIDFMIKFEELEASLKELAQTLPLDTSSIPVTKTNTRSRNEHYQSFYNAKTRDMIYEINKPIVERFSYEF